MDNPRRRYYTHGTNTRDFVTKSIIQIDSNHAQIHEGKAFTVFSRNPTITSGCKVNIRLDVPVDVYVHFQVARLATSGYGAMSMYELVNLGTGGTTIIPKNHNRAFDVASELIVTENITANLTDSIEMDHIHSGSPGGVGGSKSSGGETTGGPNEWVLRPGGSYLIEVENKDNVSIDILVGAFWYEEESG